jgi:subtilisin-like proprotein convertase family protein
VAEGVPALYLAGTVRVDSGQLTVRLEPPHGSATEWTYAVGLSPVDQAIANPDAGTWQLSIERVGGIGEYSLRLSY